MAIRLKNSEIQYSQKNEESTLAREKEGFELEFIGTLNQKPVSLDENNRENFNLIKEYLTSYLQYIYVIGNINTLRLKEIRTNT